MPAYMTDAGMRHDEGVRVRQVIVDAMLDVAPLVAGIDPVTRG